MQDVGHPLMEQILGRRLNKRSGMAEYLIKFVSRSYLHLYWLTFPELELFTPEGYQKHHRVWQYDKKARREGYQDLDDVDDLESNKVTVEKILNHKVDPTDQLDDQIAKRRRELSFPARYPHVTDYFLLDNAELLPERMSGIAKKLMNENGGEIFASAVDPDEVPDYLTIINNPMDLGAITTRLARENYYVGPSALSLFVADVRLVFTNCKEFNAEGSDIWKIADELLKTFEKWLYEWIMSPTAWLKLAPTGDSDVDANMASEFRDEAEDKYDLWSPWQVGCNICGSNENSDELLLCDRCDGEIHMGCSTPVIEELPEGEWFCVYCEFRNKYEQLVKEAANNSNDKETVTKSKQDSPKSSTPNILTSPVGGDRKFNVRVQPKHDPSSSPSKADGASKNPATNRATFFLVKWVGMSIRYSTWEKPEDIGDDEQIQRYFKFSRPPSQKEISETTCQLPCCAKRNQIMAIGAARRCEKDPFCTLGSQHDGECSRDLQGMNRPYGSKEYRKLRMMEQIKAQLFAFHCLLNNHTPDKDVLKQCGVFANAYACNKQYLTANLKVTDKEEDEDYSDDDAESSEEEEYDDDEEAPFLQPTPIYPGLVGPENDDDDEDSEVSKKPELEVTEVLSSLVEHVVLGYPTQLEEVDASVKLNCKYTPTTFKSLPTFTEYCVVLARSPFGLGLRLGVSNDDSTCVLGFQLLANGMLGPAQASQVISVGDVLVAVNNIPVSTMTFPQVIQIIAKAPTRILFHFHSRQPAYLYPPQCEARQVALERTETVPDHAAPLSDFAPYSYEKFRPMLQIGRHNHSQSSASASQVNADYSNYIVPSGPMQHLYAGIVDNSIDPHEHFASFLPVGAKKGKDKKKNKGDADEEPEANEFIPYEQSPTYKGGRTLRSYQVDGLNWMISCFKAQRSCILADEMGLGKTVQVVSFIEHLKTEESIRGPYLIVVPLSTIQHWRREIESWTDLNVCIYHDIGDRTTKFTAKDMRAVIRDQEWYYPGLGNTSVFKFHILLTTFETILADFEDIEHIHWRMVVVDEAHRLKGSGSRVLKQMRVLHCDRKLLLTGTPLQNNTQELWVLLNYLEPVKFDSLDEFNRKFGKLQSQSQVEELQKLLAPYLLRRVKEDVEKSIPPKEETIISVELTTLQKQYYRAIYDKNKSFLYRGTKNGLPTLNNIQLQLRKCCNHPFLIKGVEDRELEELGPRPNPSEVMEKTIQCSGKMVLVSKLIPKLKREGHKILIFSQFLKQLDLLQRYCEANNFGFERLDGSTGGSFRQNAIDRFSRPHSKSFIFLLSTKAGGVGINLIAADTVIIFDSDWNPMNDLQAQARCHRIGQKKSVQIYRLVTRNTYESQMFDRASRKLGLEHAVLGTASFNETSQIEKPSAEQLVELLKRGAYALMEEDDTASKQFAERDIETILKENARIRVVATTTKNEDDDEEDDEDGSSTPEEVPNYLQRKSPSKSKMRKSLGGMAVDRSSFVAEGSTGELAVDDPNFWEKVLPGAVSVEMLSLKLEDGSAVSSRQAKIKFISNLEIALDNLVSDLQNAQEDDDQRTVYNLQHEYDIAIQVVLAVTSKNRKEFSPDQLDLVKKCLNKLEKSRVRRGRITTAMRKGLVLDGQKRKRDGIDFDGSDVDGEEDDDDATPVKKQKKVQGRARSRPPKIPQPNFGSSPARSHKKKVPPASGGFMTSPLLFQNGVVNDSDDLCTLCGDGGLILLCDGPCHRSFHLECVGMDAEPDEDQWLCPDCTAGRHMCLICKQVGEMGVEFGVIQCSMAKCGRFYHKGCLLKHPRVEWVGKKRFRCPSHFCHSCGKGEGKTEAKTKSKSKSKKKSVPDDSQTIVSCIHCAQAFHPPCVKAADKYMRLSKSLMICTSHLSDKSQRPVASRRTPSKSQSNGAVSKHGSHGDTHEGAEEIPMTIPFDDYDTADSAEDVPKKASKPSKRSSISHDVEPPAPPVDCVCAFCHRGKGGVINSAAPQSDEAPSSKKKQSKKRSAVDADETVNGTAEKIVSAGPGLEGPFIDAPVKLVYSGDRQPQWVYVHLNCALHSPEVYVEPDGLIKNLDKAVKRGRQLRCSHCRVTGATIGCVVDKCKLNYHLRCAVESGGEIDESTYTLFCKTHAEEKRAAEAACGVCGRKEGKDEGGDAEEEEVEPLGKLQLTCAECKTRFHAKCAHVSDRLAARYAKDTTWKCTKCSEPAVRYCQRVHGRHCC